MDILFSLILLISSFTVDGNLLSSFTQTQKLLVQQNSIRNMNSALLNALRELYGQPSGGQSQGDLEFISITQPPLTNGTQQVDWVFDNQGRCWSAWSAPKCSLQPHTGGVTVPSMRDLDHDGIEDISCSQGGTTNGTTITNTSNKDITINCEQYTCMACATGNGTHSQCDGGTDKNALRVVETVKLTPGCIATCTINGAFGTCLDRKIPTPQATESITQVPTQAITIPPVPSGVPTAALPTIQPTGPTSTITPQPNSSIIPTQQTNQNTIIQSIISSITPEHIEDILANLIDNDGAVGVDQLQTRLISTTNFTQEMNYIKQILDRNGIENEVQTVNITNETYENFSCPKNKEIFNLIARVNGKDTVNKYLVTAHLDSREELFDGSRPAPGADDNGSGSTTVLAVAEALAKQKNSLNYSVEFVFFGGEEEGLCGSGFYLKGLNKNNIKGVINLDMVGLPNSDGKSCVNFGYKRARFDDAISNSLVAQRDAYNIDLLGSSIPTDIDASDHKHFWDNNIPAIFAHECTFNTRLHSASDKLYEGTAQNKTYILSIPQITNTAKVVAAGVYSLVNGNPASVTQTPTSGTQPTPTTIQNNNPTPTSRPAGTLMPLALDYDNYKEEYNASPPSYVYAMMNRTYNAQITTRGIQGLGAIKGNVVKMIMVSDYTALKQILENHDAAIKTAGITWVGYNAERDGRTPQDELTNITNTDSAKNTVNKYGRLTDQYGLKLMFGPTAPMWNEYFRTSPDAAVKAMIGDNCYLDGIAFQEQNQISTSNKNDRLNSVKTRTAFFRNNAPNCQHFESMVQLMSRQCKESASWEICKQFYKDLGNLQGPEKINSLAVWIIGENNADAHEFIRFLRQ